MSLEEAASFSDRLEKDEALARHVSSLRTPEEVRRFVREELGYRFTQEEMQRVVFRRNPEMSDEELEGATGGSSGTLLFLFVLSACVAAA